MPSIATRALDYVPTVEALGARSRTVGVLNFEPTPLGSAAALCGLQQAVRSSEDFAGLVSAPVRNPDALSSAVRLMRSLSVDGIVAVAPTPAASQQLAEVTAEIPLVAIAAGRHQQFPVVAIDDYRGAELATAHLLELGHDTVFHLAEPGDSGPDRRVAGWRDTLAAAGADVPDPLVGDGGPDLGYELGCLLARHSCVTAIFAATDQMALGVLRALADAKRRVPHDVSVIGFGANPDSEFFSPPLTTVRHDFAELARRSFELLRAELDRPRHGMIHETIPAELVVRRSTGPAA